MKALRPLLVHRWLRRPVTISILLLLAVWLYGLLPLWLVVAAFASRVVPGRWRLLRILWFVVLYIALEVTAVVALAALWIRYVAGGGVASERSQTDHYRLIGWFLRRVVGSARRTFGLTFRYEGDSAAASEGSPLLVFSRHAGPGDSFLLVEGVMSRLQRRPRIVLKDFLQFSPTIDLALNRVPTRFVPSYGRPGPATIDAVAELAATTGPADALVLFPEGANFTRRRREAAVAKLHEIGRSDLATIAETLVHVLPPRPTGTLAAIEAAPGADVAFVGHHGLERLSTLGDVWRGLPMDHEIAVHTWRYRADELPPPEEREAWLYSQWAELDAWLAEQIVSAGDADPVLSPDGSGTAGHH